MSPLPEPKRHRAFENLVHGSGARVGTPVSPAARPKERPCPYDGND
jgi:hypothetical protein